MLELKNITKDYDVGTDKVHALKGVSLAFRENEMVSILGQSGCGKTTLLNIIGGLDRYTGGDLIINGRSTEYFKASDWDAYRNQKIGFVFQSYNLIPHLTVLGNVELALTLSGIKKSERRARAVEALRKVGLDGELKKRPNQMSGGQMQRVAIARAIVNNPDIILADEPTGALDSNTSVAVMDILKDIARDRLVIMVTHNRALAEEYSTRIISMLDGEVTDDTSPVPFSDGGAETTAITDGSGEKNEDGDVREKAEPTVPADNAESELDAERAEKLRKKQHKKEQKAITKANKAALKRTSMSLWTAFGLSWRNLVTKKGRTIATAVAGSIGIIGVALVLSLSNGFNNYIEDMQTSMLAHYPVTATNLTVDMDAAMASLENNGVKLKQFPDGNKIIINPDKPTAPFRYNRITKEYLEHVENMPEGLAIDVLYDYARSKPVVSKNMNGGYGVIKTSASSMNSMIGSGASTFQQLLNNTEYVRSQYDVLKGSYPTKADEIAIVIGSDNSINVGTLRSVGLAVPEKWDNVTFDTFLGQELKLVYNDQWFEKDENGIYRSFDKRVGVDDAAAWKALYDDPANLTLKVVGVMRIKESAALALFSTGLVYTPALNENFMENCRNSAVAKAQAQSRDRYISDCSTTVIDSILSVVTQMMGEELDLTGMEFNSPKLQSLYAIAHSMDINISPAEMFDQSMYAVGATDLPSGLNFYPVTFAKKTDMVNYLNKYNKCKADVDKILTLDAASLVTTTVSDMIDIISYVLVAFAAISLLVSSVMISIITFASVVERTKEIGVLRAVGARKTDIMRVFNAETIIIGFAAGVFGVLVTLILSFPLSSLFISISDGMITTSLVSLAWWHALLLIGVSVLLTTIAGMLPARSASKRDPVVALRSE